ncbi:amino acid racemase [Cryomorphaceae bacterium 1068]|nr:amino acid racemase [Cryomorphaceae bacterium 1068]
MKILGLIGGTSWHATQEYYRLINEGFCDANGSLESPKLILYSINIAVMRAHDKDKIIDTYTDVSKKLEQAGAEAIVICANTPHLVCDTVQKEIGIPFLHIADATGNEAKRLRLNKLGLLGTKPTMKGRFISGVLKENFGMEVITPEGDRFDTTHDYISNELTQGIFSDEAKSFYLQEIKRMKERGADGIILGCTELPILLKDTKADLPLLATTDLHAQMAVDFILS